MSSATRVGLGVLSALLSIALVNDVFGLGLVGQHSRRVLVVLCALTLGALYKAGVFRPQAELTAEELPVTTRSKNQPLIISLLWLLTIALVPVLILGPRIYRGEPIQLLHWLILVAALAFLIHRWRRDRKPH